MQRTINISYRLGNDGEPHEDLRTIGHATVSCMCTALALVSMHGDVLELLAALPEDDDNQEQALQVCSLFYVASSIQYYYYS